MTPSTLLPLVLASLLMPASLPASERPADATAPPAVGATSTAVAPLVRLAVAAHEKPGPAGAALSLLALLHMQQAAWRVSQHLYFLAPFRTALAARVLPEAPGVSTLDASPLARVARRVGAQRFNTEDGSSDDFAICYRLNGRSSVQVLPGDPAPVKIPVSSMANNTGVTVGLVVRLSRSR